MSTFDFLSYVLPFHKLNEKKKKYQTQSKHLQKTKSQSNLIDRLISGRFRSQMISLGNGHDYLKTNLPKHKHDDNSIINVHKQKDDPLSLWCTTPHYLRHPKMNNVGRYECPQKNCHKNYKEMSSLHRHIR